MEKKKACIEASIIDEEKSSVKLSGSEVDILVLVASIVASLKNAGIDDDNIEFAVKLGINSHRQDSLSNILKELFKN